MRAQGVSFSVVKQAAWAPGLTEGQDWARWAAGPALPPTGDGADPGVKAMPALLRRRAGLLGKMALEVAYQCLDGRTGVPTVFCSRHGEVARAVTLLTDLARGDMLSPTSFGMSVHNATAGLLTIARAERASHIALAAGAATVEHAVIEACGLLADGAAMVLLVACDCPLPEPLLPFQDCAETPHAWAWLLAPAGAGGGAMALRWSACDADAKPDDLPGSLAVLRFQLGDAARLERVARRRRWVWSRDA